MSKSKFINVGALMKKKDGGYYIKLDNETSIVIDGDEFKGGYLSVSKPSDKYNRMIAKNEEKMKNGEMSEEEYNVSLEDLTNKSKRFDKDGDLNYIKMELTAVRD